MDKQSYNLIKRTISEFLMTYRIYSGKNINYVLKTKYLVADYIESYGADCAESFRRIYIGEFAKLTADMILGRIGIRPQ